MAELVFQNSNGNDVTTSLLVAEVFGKEHSKVVRDIESLSCSASFNAANFGVITYIDSRNREQTAYEMTKDGFSFLVMGYTGVKAGEFKERFINEFNRREALLKDDDYILMRSQQILQKRIEIAEEKIKCLEQQNSKRKMDIMCVKITMKNIFSLFVCLKKCCTFVVLQLTIKYANGIFYARKETYILKYRQTISVYHRPMAMVGCSKLGYLSAFLFNNK